MNHKVEQTELTVRRAALSEAVRAITQYLATVAMDTINASSIHSSGGGDVGVWRRLWAQYTGDYGEAREYDGVGYKETNVAMVGHLAGVEACLHRVLDRLTEVEEALDQCDG